MRFRVLGAFEAEAAGGRVRLQAGMQTAVAARLLLADGRPVSVDQLIEDLWGEAAPDSANVSVRVQVSRIRKALAAAGADDVIRTQAPGYSLVLAEADEVDSRRFEALALQGFEALARHEHGQAADTLAAALGLWRGRTLADLADYGFARDEASRLEELRLRTLEARVEADLALGRHAGLVAELETLVREHPTRERLWGQRITVLYRCGRQAEALAAYGELRSTLREELGIDPSPELRAIEAAVLRQDSSLGSKPSAALPTGVVTFLLTDIEGSTAMWDHAPADMAAALERHDALVTEVVSAAGGVLIKSKGEGDATLSVFVRASAAVVAAVELQRAIAGEPWPAATPLRVRVALHTGEAHERNQDYFGPAVNRAARLRSLAQGGQVLLSQATSELVIDHLPPGSALHDRGRHELSGLSRGEQVFELGAEAMREPAASSVARVQVALPKSLMTGDAFVGRADECGLLRAAWSSLTPGAPRLWLVSGEPGIGKTRLAAEVARTADAGDGIVLFGRCDEDLGVPYQPFAEALRSYIRSCPPELLRSLTGRVGGELARLLPELSGVLSGPTAPSRMDPESERFLLFEAFAWLLAKASVATPMLLILDDLHWAAKPTLLMLRHLLRSDEQMQLMVLATYRDTELDRAHPLADVLSDLRQSSGAERVELRGLGADEIEEYLTTSAGHELPDGSSGFARALHEQTDGNPLFVGEVMRSLIDSGAIRLEDGRWKSDLSLGDFDLPEGLKQAITRRLSRLSADANTALATASVVGPEFSLAVVERASGLPSAIEAMDESVRTGMLHESATGFTFSHALIRQTLYSELSAAKRMRLHRLVGEAIESLPGEPQLEALAYHFAEAALDGQIEKAADYALKAGAKALERLAFEDASALADRGLAVLSLEPDVVRLQRADLLLLQASCFMCEYDYVALKECAVAAAEVARRVGSPERLARAAIVYNTDPDYGVSDPRLRELVDEALQALGDSEPALRARLLAGLGLHLSWSERRRADGTSLCARAIGIARESGDRQALGHAITCHLCALSGLRDLGEALSLADELVSLGTANDPLSHRFPAHLQRAQIHLELGDRDRFDADLRRFVDSAPSEFRGLDFYIKDTVIFPAMLDGRFDEALEASFGRDILRTDRNATSSNQLRIAWMLRETGQLAAFLESLRASADPAQVGLPAARAFNAAVEAELGDKDLAARQMNGLAADDFASIDDDLASVAARCLLAEACVHLEDETAAAVLYEQLLWNRGRLASPGNLVLCLGAVDRYAGMCAIVLRRFDDAVAHLEAALALEDGFRTPPHAARTRYWLGRALLARGDAGRARSVLTDCLSTADELGMAVLAREARELLRPPLPPQLSSDRIFVGRDAELERIAALLEQAFAGERRAALLSGEPGIGKTRLAAEVARKAKESGAVVLYGRCDEQVGFAYQPFVEAIRSLLPAVPVSSFVALGRRAGDLARIVPEIVDSFADTPQGARGEADAERYESFEAVVDLISAASRTDPILLVVDDLHWATTPTLQLLRHLLRSQSAMRVMVLATYRDTDLDRAHPLSGVLADLRREHGVERIAISGLGAGDTLAFVQASRSGDTAGLAAALYRETEGNPFFMQEVLAHLSETGQTASLPEGVREVIGRRLSRLSDDANRALGVAAVLGTAITPAILEAIPEAGDRVLDGLEEAAGAGLLRADGARFEFSHALVRQTLVAELSPARRVRLHRRVGEALEATGSKDLDALAYHFAEAAPDGQAEKAAGYALAIARRSWRLSPEEALVATERGLAALEFAADGLELRSDLLIARSRALWTSLGSSNEDVKACRIAAAAAARACADWVRFAVAARELAAHSVIGIPDERVSPLVEEALGRVPDSEPALRAGLLANWSVYLYNCEGAVERAKSIAREALDLARAVGDPEALMRALRANQFQPYTSDQIAEARDIVAQQLLYARQIDDVDEEVIAEETLGQLSLAEGDLSAYRDMRLRLQGRQWGLADFDDADALMRGDWDAASAGIIGSFQRQDPNEDFSQFNAAGRFCWLWYEIGNIEPVLPQVEEFIGRFPTMTVLRTVRAALLAELRRFEEAREELEWISSDGFGQLGHNELLPLGLALSATACCLLGDKETASALLDTLLPYSGLLLMVAYTNRLGAADRFLGMLATTLGRFEQAEELFDKALELEARVESPPFLARTKYWYARMLLQRGGAGYGERALVLLHDSLAAAERLGMATLAEQARELLSEAGPP